MTPFLQCLFTKGVVCYALYCINRYAIISSSIMGVYGSLFTVKILIGIICSISLIFTTLDRISGVFILKVTNGTSLSKFMIKAGIYSLAFLDS